MCDRHQLPFVGQTCGEGYCKDCSREYLDWLFDQPTAKYHYKIWKEVSDGGLGWVWKWEII